jgi:peptidoglycan lytic transglycosylase
VASVGLREQRMKAGVRALALAAFACLAACATQHHSVERGAAPTSGTMRPYEVGGVWYYPARQPHYDEVGLATWYGSGDGYGCRSTANGEQMDPSALTAAHKTLPLPSIVEVTNLENGKQVRVRVNDRGPFVAGRIIDLSPAAAKMLGIRSSAKVRVKYIGPADAKAMLSPAAWRPSGRHGC